MRFLILPIAAALCCTGCPAASTPPESRTPPRSRAEPEPPTTRPAPEDPVRRAAPPPFKPSCTTPQPVSATGHLAAAHILIFYSGASRAPAHIQRTKADAAKLAQSIVAMAHKPGASFARLAARYSEGPTRTRGGRLGRFTPNRMVPPFSAAVKATCIGDVIGPVETRFGFHVILREQP